MRLLSIFFCLLPLWLSAQQNYAIETRDIDHFWKACDQLETAKTKADSIQIIQTGYIDKATPGFKKFIQIRNFTAAEYVMLLSRFPKFWKSIRPLTERIATRKPELETVFDRFRGVLPGFKQPDVCFAIGCLRTGGTTGNDLILIGSEIVAADSTVDKSELTPWLKSVMGTTGDIVAMVAHETVHTQQFGGSKHSLITGVLNEGIADFIAEKVAGRTINAHIHAYGNAHTCTLWKDFEKDMAETPRDISNWLYQGNSATSRPADLGYFIGYKIAEAYYDKQTDKQKALKTLLNRKKYGRVFKESSFGKIACR